MDSDNLVLVVGAYADADAAAGDFKALKAGQDSGEYKVVGAVVMDRDASGNVDVKEHGDAHVAGGAMLGGTAGLVVGLFAPPLLAATAIGAGIGAGIGALRGGGGRRRPVRRQGRGRSRQLGQEDQPGDRLGRLPGAARSDREVPGRGVGRNHLVDRREEGRHTRRPSRSAERE